VYAPGKTTNPRDPSRTPGGSSSGSAAAVAANMVPLAIGTQTNGSVIRPASFCGVFGFKPSHGVISRHRVLHQSRLLDQVGVFARTIEDCALIAQQLLGFDERDPDTRPRAPLKLVETMMEEPPVTPQLGFLKTAVWDRAGENTKEAFAELTEHLGENIAEYQLHGAFDAALEVHRTIMEADLARSLAREYERGKDKLSPELREKIERGQAVRAVDYNNAVDQIALFRGLFGEVFERYDAILTPAANGEAPAGLAATGDPAFCTHWTLCGMPAITLPLLRGSNGMPMGVQLVAPKGDDGRLLRTARWLDRQIEA
jgi:Asp-tRNA(Asn)/Glu-tRNA(Gln) amidotransferase A subunit family amidase